ncbi:D-amino acid dehydrogenase [Comamonas humi]
MKLAVIGAGIVGVATAFELLEDGHEVSLYERHRTVAEGASFAQAGLLWPCMANPWGAAAFADALQLGFSRPGFAALDIKGSLLSSTTRWGRRHRKHAKLGAAVDALPALQALEALSMQRMQQVLERFELDGQFTQSWLLPFRKEPTAAALYELTRRLSAASIEYEQLTPEQAREREPGLASDAALSGALHLPQAWAGNGRFFAQGLLHALVEQGLDFRPNQAIDAMQPGAGGVQLKSGAETTRFDAVVVCAGAQAPSLLQPHGIKLPTAAVEGFTISAPIAEETLAPRGSIVDLERGYALTRFGNRLRISGGAQLGHASDETRTDQAGHYLITELLELFPGSIQRAESTLQHWQGARMTMPDGLPVVGPSGLPGIWLNTAHGGYGWSLAMGSARHLALQIAGAESPVDSAAFALQR